MKVFALMIRYYVYDAASVSLHTTRAGCLGELGEWVYERWSTRREGQAPTGDMPADVATFFSSQKDDYRYEIKERELHGQTIPEEPLGPDEVLLNPDEVAAVMGSLSSAAPHQVGRSMGTTAYCATVAMNSAYAKLIKD